MSSFIRNLISPDTAWWLCAWHYSRVNSHWEPLTATPPNRVGQIKKKKTNSLLSITPDVQIFGARASLLYESTAPACTATARGHRRRPHAWCPVRPPRRWMTQEKNNTATRDYVRSTRLLNRTQRSEGDKCISVQWKLFKTSRSAGDDQLRMCRRTQNDRMKS